MRLSTQFDLSSTFLFLRDVLAEFLVGIQMQLEKRTVASNDPNEKGPNWPPIICLKTPSENDQKNNERCSLNLLMNSKSDIECESTRTLYGFNLKNDRSLTPSLKFGIFHAMETLVQQPGRLKHALVSPMLYSTTLTKPEKRCVGYESCPDF